MIRTDLSPSAIQLDGIFLEDMLPDRYLTLGDYGREVLTKEVNTVSNKFDGSTLNYTRYPERHIEVRYIVWGETIEEFRSNCTKLMKFFDSCNETDIVFNDAADKFITADSIVAEIPERHGLSAEGTFTLVCSDPYFYSTSIYEALPVSTEGNSSTFAINYTGTAEAYPVFEAKFAAPKVNGDYSDDGDCGFIAFTDLSENILQFGNPEALDYDASAQALTFINREMDSLTGFGSSVKTFSDTVINGTMSANVNVSDIYYDKGTGKVWKSAKPYTLGSGSEFHGGGLSYPVNAVENFEVTGILTLSQGYNNTAEGGIFEIGIWNSSVMIAGFRIYKTGNGSSSSIDYIVNNIKKGSTTLDTSCYNTNFGLTSRSEVYQTQYYNKKKKKWQTAKIKGVKTRKVVSGYTYSTPNKNFSIIKNGTSVTFSVGNLAKVTYTDSAVENLVGINFSMVMGSYKTNAVYTNFGLANLKVARLAGRTFSETQNVFHAGDVLTADTSNASIYIKRNGTSEGNLAMEYGSLGNDWESFVLVPGSNYIQASWSAWVNQNYKPDIKILYNERYL